MPASLHVLNPNHPIRPQPRRRRHQQDRQRSHQRVRPGPGSHAASGHRDTEAVYLYGLGSEGELRVRRASEGAPK